MKLLLLSGPQVFALADSCKRLHGAAWRSLFAEVLGEETASTIFAETSLIRLLLGDIGILFEMRELDGLGGAHSYPLPHCRKRLGQSKEATDNGTGGDL